MKLFLHLLIVYTITASQALNYGESPPDNGSRFKLTAPTERPAGDLSHNHLHSGTLESPDVIDPEHTSSEEVSGSFEGKTFRFRRPRAKKVYPGQYADKRKNRNWKQWPEYVKSPISPSDSKIAWSYWEEDDSEGWEPDDADDSKPTTAAPTTTTTTTTTAAPTTTTTTTTTPKPTTSAPKEKPPVSIHKHFHYFKKTGPWKGEMMDPPPPTTAMPPPMEDMKMTEDMMMEMMMKGMMMMDPPPVPEMDKKEKGGIFDRLSKVDPVTVLVAGIVPASLILAAVLPSVMGKVMAMKGEMAMPVPMISTTAVSGEGRSVVDDGMARLVRAVGDFGRQALEKPQCARKMFCRMATDSIVGDSPVVQRAVRLATIAMEDSWLDHLGVRSLFESLNDGSCHQVECDAEPTT